MERSLVQKSKVISYVLRHKPEEYGIVLDDNGYVDISILIEKVNQKHSLGYLSIDIINEIMKSSDKKRFEISNEKIRAMYGHSCKTEVKHTAGIPPEHLYHGTSHQAYEKIKNEGLLPMKRQHVHLSESLETAVIVGSRRDKNPVILKIDSDKMVNDGVKFYVGNDRVWLCDYVYPMYITEAL